MLRRSGGEDGRDAQSGQERNRNLQVTFLSAGPGAVESTPWHHNQAGAFGEE